MTSRDDNPATERPGADVLADWTAALAAALDIPAAAVDTDAVLALAGTIAHSVVRPAAPISTYLVGFAAGQAAANGDRDAFPRLAALAQQLAETRDPGPLPS